MTTTKPILTEAAESGLWYERLGERHQVVFVEYVGRQPHSVVTLHHWDHSDRPWFRVGRDLASGVCMTYWDFDWCKRDKTLYRHSSGMGGKFQIEVHPFTQRQPPPGEIWAAEGMELVRSGGRRIKSDVTLLKMGIRRLRRPRLLTDLFTGQKSRNPFDVADEGETIYCARCKDHLPCDNPCNCMGWCDECGWWVYFNDLRYQEDYGDGLCKHLSKTNRQ